MATNILLISDWTIMSVQGGVFPQWQHGSSVTYIVAPRVEPFA